MLISSMDQLNYYAMPKDGYLEIDTSATGYSMGQASMLGSEEGSPTYLNEENSPKNGTKSSLYKTELCKRFSEFGSCRYGAKCQFAHGLNELRHVVRHPKYKTTKCKSYWGSGHCPYGSRCRFIHEETESMTTPPQYSPPSSMGGMFLHDKNPPHLTRLNSNSSDLGLNGGEGYLYGPGASNNAEHVLAGSYHGLSSPFDKESSGSTPWSRSQAKLNYASESYVKQQGGVSQAPNGANGGYPDLQDAIDALMKFSLSPGDNEPAPSNSNLGTISTTPHAATTGAPTVGATTGATPEPSTKADYSLDSDELWKDFPSLSHHSSVDHMDHFSDKEWPAGLSLSLEGTGLFNGLGESESPAGSPPSSGKKEGTSPRLSIFERFH